MGVAIKPYAGMSAKLWTKREEDFYALNTTDLELGRRGSAGQGGEDHGFFEVLW